MLHEETGQKKGSNELGKDDLEDKFLGTMNRDLYLHFVGELFEIFVSHFGRSMARFSDTA